MKRKPPAHPEPVVSPEILAAATAEFNKEAKRTLGSERPMPAVRCSVCGGEATLNPAEQLCWVCRRLKISAWREIDTQAPAQE